jgi:hypothetical protein
MLGLAQTIEKGKRCKEKKREENLFVFGTRWRVPRKLPPAQRDLRLPAIMVAPLNSFIIAPILFGIIKHYCRREQS